MIVFEEKFRELISLLPEQGAYSFPVRYDWGTIDVLNKFLYYQRMYLNIL
jgi:hypothetical protein